MVKTPTKKPTTTILSHFLPGYLGVGVFLSVFHGVYDPKIRRWGVETKRFAVNYEYLQLCILLNAGWTVWNMSEWEPVGKSTRTFWKGEKYEEHVFNKMWLNI